MSDFEKNVKKAMKDAGITEKGEKLTRIIWILAPTIFKAAPEGAGLMQVAETAGMLLKHYAADLELRNRIAAQGRPRRRNRVRGSATGRG